MKCEDIKKLMMGYLDNEITENERKVFEEHIHQCKECSLELAEFKKLKEVTDNMKLNEPEEEIWTAYWAGIYNRLERGAGWILFSIGVIIMLCYGGYKAVEELINDPQIGLFVKIAIFAIIGGFSILLVSVVRERLYFWKKDRYRLVRR